MSRGLTWESLEAVLGDPPEHRAEDRYALRPWDGPPGQCWRFWNLVWQLRRERQHEALAVLPRVA